MMYDGRALHRQRNIPIPSIECSHGLFRGQIIRTFQFNISESYKENGNPPPTWNERAGSVYVTFRPPSLSEDQAGTKLGLSGDQVEILRNCMEDKAITELMTIVGRTNRTKFRDQVLKPLINDGLLEMTIPDKPRSSKQKYRLTAKGRKLIQDSKFKIQD